MTIEWWDWAAFGVGLIVTELFLPSMVLVWFGLGSLLVACTRVLFPDWGFGAQLLVWIISSIAFVLLWFQVFKSMHHGSLIGRASAQVIGEVGLLVSSVEPFHKGQVRFQKPLFGSDVWNCIADEEIEAGERVQIVSVEGSILKIARVVKEEL